MARCCRQTGMFVPMIVAALVPLLAGQGCPGPIADYAQLGASGAYQNVTPAEASAVIEVHQADARFVILDVRSPEEYATGHLENAQNVCVLCSSPSFQDVIQGFDKTLTYLVYCHSGNRSKTASGIMAADGFANVYNMTGGITQWQAAGYPTVP